MIRIFVRSGIAAATFAFPAVAAQAQSTVKIGVLLPMTGPQQSTGVQVAAAMRLYMAQHGDAAAGKKIELILKDDGAVADASKRLAQELIGNSTPILTVLCACAEAAARASAAAARPNLANLRNIGESSLRSNFVTACSQCARSPCRGGARSLLRSITCRRALCQQDEFIPLRLSPYVP